MQQLLCMLFKLYCVKSYISALYHPLIILLSKILAPWHQSLKQYISVDYYWPLVFGWPKEHINRCILYKTKIPNRCKRSWPSNSSKLLPHLLGFFINLFKKLLQYSTSSTFSPPNSITALNYPLTWKPQEKFAFGWTLTSHSRTPPLCVCVCVCVCVWSAGPWSGTRYYKHSLHVN